MILKFPADGGASFYVAKHHVSSIVAAQRESGGTAIRMTNGDTFVTTESIDDVVSGWNIT